MVLGLLTLAAIPTTIGVSEAVSNRNAEKDKAKDDELLRKFTLRCYCDAESRKRGEVDGGDVVLRGGKLYVNPPPSPQPLPSPPPSFPFKGFYIPFPDPDRKPEQPLGLVTFCSDDPPALNWIYIDKSTRQLKHGNRTDSKPHLVGPWGWEAGEEGGAGGVTYDGEEGAVAVETEDGWEIRWEDEDAKVGRVNGRRVLNISLEREFVDDGDDSHRKKEDNEGNKVVKVKENTKAGNDGGLAIKTTAVPTGKSRKKQEIRDEDQGAKGKVFEMKTTTRTKPLGEPQAREKKTESKLEMSTKTTED